MSFWRTFYHIVWATKDRHPIIKPEFEPRLYSYLMRKASEIGVIVYAMNGWCDHVHLVTSIPPKLAVAEVVKLLKGSSSHDLSSAGINFAWQRGYGVLTLGESQKSSAIEYVRNQKEHHEQHTVNSWLERYTELDEGPQDTGIKLDRVAPLIRESKPLYDTLGEPPF